MIVIAFERPVGRRRDHEMHRAILKLAEVARISEPDAVCCRHVVAPAYHSSQCYHHYIAYRWRQQKRKATSGPVQLTTVQLTTSPRIWHRRREPAPGRRCP